MAAKELSELAPSPREVFEKNMDTVQWQNAAAVLFTPEQSGKLNWDDVRILSDAQAAIIKSNARSDSVLVLPEEKELFWEVHVCRPETVIGFDLGPELMEEYRDTVLANAGDASGQELFMLSW